MDQDVWNRDDGHLAQGAKMIAAAFVSAALTAAVVIALGQAMVARHAPVQPTTEAILVRTSG